MANTVTEMFDELIQSRRGKALICDEQRTLTAEDFDSLVNAIAAMLPSDVKRVAIVMDHSVEMIAAMFAVLRAGAAYIPAEPSFPKERVRYMFGDAEAECVITNSRYSPLIEGLDEIIVDSGMSFTASDKRVAGSPSPDDIAYILYTSGSTGKPKGVAVCHKNVCHYVRAFKKEFSPCVDDVMLQYSVCSFDIFVEEVFAALLSGAKLAIPSTETRSDIGRTLAFVEDKRVTMISAFPYLLEQLNELDSLPPCLRLLISGGDVLRYSYVDKLLDRVCVYNTYGPSETTVCASYFRCDRQSALADGTFPIGRPVQGADIIIMDERHMAVKAGTVGEICIMGGGIAKGYIGDIPVESDAFSVTESGERIYYSGDMGYVLPDGNIAFLYRKDSQVMIYGKRVEPMEVENVLLKVGGVKAGCVRAAQDENGLSYLTAYFVADESVQASDIRREMKRYLADFMIPEFFVRMAAIALNANGKIDDKALPIVMR